MINSQFLKLHFSQLVKAWKISKYNSYSDAQKQNYHNNLSELFSCLKKVNFDLQSPTEQQELKEVIDFFILSLQFLNNSTVNCVPYEIVECLKVAMNEWIDKCNNYIIVTSYNQYSFNPYLVVSGPYTIIKTRFNIIFDKKLVQINLPQHLSNDYLCNAVLYHELGHFIDQVQNIYPPIKSILWANKDKVDCQKYFPYISDSRYPEPYRQAILQNHIKEYFADIFAAQYIRESSFYYLEYIAGKNGISETHPATSNRVLFIKEFLSDHHKFGFVLNTFIREIKKQTNKDLLLRYIDISPDDLLNLIPNEIIHKEQLHSLFYQGWNIWLNRQDDFKVKNNMRESLNPSIIYQIINNLIEKSINNYLIVKKWKTHQPLAHI